MSSCASLEWNVCEVDLVNATWGSWVSAVEFLDKVVDCNVVCIRPGVLLIPKSFPGNQVLEFATEDVTVHDLFNLSVFFTVDNVWLGNYGVLSAGDRIAWRRE